MMEDEFDDPLGLRPVSDGRHTQRIKALVSERWQLPAQTTVMVTELRCHEAGCPDLETVVALMMPGAPRQSVKIGKPMHEVRATDLEPLAVWLTSAR
ncbi:MAG: hypothetical protein KDK91_03520 [Gammaproteobacteria bacterium]|nr:hypothetical protein [Gammaproteobacteria bacterium]